MDVSQLFQRLFAKCAVLLMVVSAVCWQASAFAGELTQARVDALLAELSPTADEPWRTVPWQVSVLEAQRIALESGKPIFIWAMDGHPLGCV
ncbi:MAG: hypothetical protein ACIAXF_07105 [Phycisphaerales bacterium JB063]